MIKEKKVAEINEKAIQLIKENRTAANDLFTKAFPKANKAEIEMLKDHPLKTQIIQSKEVMELAQKIIDDSYDVADMNAYKTNFPTNTSRWKNYIKGTSMKKFRLQKSRRKTVIRHSTVLSMISLGKMRIITAKPKRK